MLRFLTRLFLVALIAAVAASVAFWVMANRREVRSAEALALPESRLVETVHGAIHVLEDGPSNGVPVLLVHGSVGWAGLWRDTMAALAKQGYRVIALDLPPMGLSERFPGMDYSRQAQGLRILAVAETLEKPPVLVAHSFGAGAAMEAIMAGEQAFRSGVIVAGALGLGQDGTGQHLPLPLRPPLVREVALASTVTNPLVTKPLFQQFVFRKDSITPDIIGLLEYPFQREGTTAALAEWLPTLLVPPRGAASSDAARYAALGLPVALIWGREDTVTPPVQGEALQAALGDAPIFWMDSTGHIPQIEAPEAFHARLAAALAYIEDN